MSLVLVYANNENAIIMSDGRAGGTENPSEIYDKTRKINENIIMGFVGYRETGEHFIKCIHMELEEKIDKCYIDEFMEVVEYGMGLNATKEKMRSTFLMIGRTKEKEMKVAVAGKDTNYQIIYIPLNRITFIGGTIPEEEIMKICKENSDTNDSTFEIFKKTIVDVSKIDKSVNENIFYQTI